MCSWAPSIFAWDDDSKSQHTNANLKSKYASESVETIFGKNQCFQGETSLHLVLGLEYLHSDTWTCYPETQLPSLGARFCSSQDQTPSRCRHSPVVWALKAHEGPAVEDACAIPWLAVCPGPGMESPAPHFLRRGTVGKQSTTHACLELQHGKNQAWPQQLFGRCGHSAAPLFCKSAVRLWALCLQSGMNKIFSLGVRASYVNCTGAPIFTPVCPQQGLKTRLVAASRCQLQSLNSNVTYTSDWNFSLKWNICLFQHWAKKLPPGRISNSGRNLLKHAMVLTCFSGFGQKYRLGQKIPEWIQAGI